MTDEKIELAVLPLESMRSEPIFVAPAGDASIKFEFERGQRLVRGGLHFEKVRSYRYRAESHCTYWHIHDAYETLVEVVGSSWVAELVDVQPLDRRDQWEIHHFMVYVEDDGCYEIAAQSWSWLPEESIDDDGA